MIVNTCFTMNETYFYQKKLQNISVGQKIFGRQRIINNHGSTMAFSLKTSLNLLGLFTLNFYTQNGCKT